MEGIARTQWGPVAAGGASPVAAVKVMDLARKLGIDAAWSGLWLGAPTARSSSYRAEHRVKALLAGLAWGAVTADCGSEHLPRTVRYSQVTGLCSDERCAPLVACRYSAPRKITMTA